MNRITPFIQLIRLDKPIGIYLLLWATLWGLEVASPFVTNWSIVVIFLTGVLLMRSAGCAINDFADRHFDGDVKRTKNRPLVIGALAPWQALATAALLVTAAAYLVFQLNDKTISLAVIALLLAILYPFTKRWLWFPQLFLALAFSMSIPMAFSAYQSEVPPIAWYLAVINIIWVLSYDTIYAMIDAEDDKILGIKSIALRFGTNTPRVVLFLHTLFLTMLVLLGIIQSYNAVFYLLLLVVALQFTHQHNLIRANTAESLLQAFQHNQWVGAAMFLALLLSN